MIVQRVTKKMIDAQFPRVECAIPSCFNYTIPLSDLCGPHHARRLSRLIQLARRNDNEEERMKDPIYRAKRNAYTAEWVKKNKYHDRPEVRARRKAYFSRPSVKQRMKEYNQRYWAVPENRERRKLLERARRHRKKEEEARREDV